MVVAIVVGLAVAFLTHGGILIRAKAPQIGVVLKGDSRLVVGYDGFLGDFRSRIWRLDDAWRGATVVSVGRGASKRFDPELTIDAIVAWVKSSHKAYDEILFMGLSMGAKIQHEVVVRLQDDPQVGPKLVGLALIDPLHDGSGSKLKLGPFRIASMLRWFGIRPSWLSNIALKWAPGMMVGVKASKRNLHQRAGAAQPVSYVIDQARYSAGPAVEGKVKVPVFILTVPPEDDEVLYGHQAERWRKRYPDAWYEELPPGETRHAGFDTEPWVWESPTGDLVAAAFS